MLKTIEEYSKYVAIAGFKNARIGSTEEFLHAIRSEQSENVDIQLFDAEKVAGWQHLYFAALNALTAFKSKVNISKSLEMETMLYASSQRQIRRAMGLLGINPDTSAVAVLVIGEKAEDVKSALSHVSKHVNAQRDDGVLELTNEKVTVIRKIFGISDVELETVMKNGGLENALTDLVIEWMALLATQH